ncbi:30S ribosomal protein S17 [candidate division NPL-UPA2 bacterium]|nr:30S ribosomal protein S17 [candidate division NPL-UPA2 bacterium]
MKERGQRKTRSGKVVSDKMDKTIVVAVERLVRHPLYKRVVRKTTKFKVDDGKNEAGVGDKVEIMEIKPLSKEKRWRMIKIIEKSKR